MSSKRWRGRPPHDLRFCRSVSQRRLLDTYEGLLTSQSVSQPQAHATGTTGLPRMDTNQRPHHRQTASLLTEVHRRGRGDRPSPAATLGQRQVGAEIFVENGHALHDSALPAPLRNLDSVGMMISMSLIPRPDGTLMSVRSWGAGSESYHRLEGIARRSG